MSQPQKSWVPKGIALLVIGLIIGSLIGIFAVAPLQARPTTTTPTVIPTTTTVTTTVTATPTVTTLTGPITIGALLSLSGDLRSFGENERAGLELARDDINSWLANVRPGVKVELAIEDTATQPEQALTKLQALAARGVKMVVGPLSSGEVRNLKTYADQNNILIASQSSTAVDLAVPDNIFRFVPDDRAQGPALARLMWDAGIKLYIPVWRGDTYGDGLKGSTEAAFKKLGGTVDAGIRYNPETKEFGTEMATLATKVQDAISKQGAKSVAVHLISFEEAVTLFNEANKRDVLKQVRWFGSDGTAGAASLPKDQVVAEFSIKTKFVNTIFAPTSSSLFERVKQQVQSQVGREPESYTYAIYDILWVYTLSILAVDKYDPVAVKQVLPVVASQFFGASGWTILNEAGDRRGADYDVWVIEKTDGAYDWKIAGTYVSVNDKVSWKPGFDEKYR